MRGGGTGKSQGSKDFFSVYKEKMSNKNKLAHAPMDLNSMEKPEVSKALYGQIQWEDLLRSGVFLAHQDVRQPSTK